MCLSDVKSLQGNNSLNDTVCKVLSVILEYFRCDRFKGKSMSADELTMNTSSGSDSSPSSNKVTFGNALQNPNIFPVSFCCPFSFHIFIWLICT